MLSDSDTEDLQTLTINEHYARAFEYRKEREELAKLKEKYGSDIDEDDVASETDSEEAESEDEDGEELTPAMDAAILRTLVRIKKKDPAIYEKETNIFEEEIHKTRDTPSTSRTKTKKDKSKPLTIRQQNIASALHPESRSPSPEPLTHVEEQAALRDETIAAFHTAVADEDDEDGLLVPREKTKDEIEREEEEYRAFLEREVGEDLRKIVTVEGEDESIAVVVKDEPESSDRKKKKKGKKAEEKATKSTKEEEEEFLMNYILNRGWIDRAGRRLPTYQEIVSKKQKKNGTEAKREGESSGAESEQDESADENAEGQLQEIDDDEFFEMADAFESSYNFRFEEPGATTIQRYPRNIASVVRREDTVRKEARERRKQRKEEEILKKKEEVQRLKALKVKELRHKLEKIGKEGGKNLEETLALQELDLEGEWDPEKHDRQMAQLYENEEGADEEYLEKPAWDDDIDVDGIVPPEEQDLEGPSKKKKKKKKKGKEDENADAGVDVDEMDAEAQLFQNALGEEEWDGTEEMRKHVLEQYMDQLYEMEFNDMVGDLPTRFKYAPVDSENFALTPAEILTATDAELNAYVGLKKFAPYRKDANGKGRQWDGTRTSRLKELRTKLAERGIEAVHEEGRKSKGKKRMGKKERMKKAEPEADGDEDVESQDQEGKKRKRERVSANETMVTHVAEDSPMKKKRRRPKKHDTDA